MSVDPAALQAMMAQQQKKKAGPPPKKQIPKLFNNDHNSKVLKAFNGIYKLFYIVKMFSGKFLWYSSCGKTLNLK